MSQIEQKEEDIEVTDSITDQLSLWRRKLQPHRRPIIIIGSLLMITLVVFLGFAWNEVRKCDSVGGVLDARMACHPGYIKALEECGKIGGKLDDKMKCHTKNPRIDFTNWNLT